jgi:hypothetical protein
MVQMRKRRLHLSLVLSFVFIAGCSTACPCADLQREIIADRHAYLQGMAERDALKEQVIACKMKQEDGKR